MKDFAAHESNLSDRIGALELSDEPRMDDGGLEAAASIGPAPTKPRQFGGTCIGDAVLEAAGENSAFGPSQAGCFPPTIRGFNCIDDRALEDTASIAAAGPTSNPAFCPLTSPGLQHR
jgi:hypothetical protein